MEVTARAKTVAKSYLEALGLLEAVRPLYHRIRMRLDPPRFTGDQASLPRHLNLAISFKCLAACPHCYFIQEDSHVFRGKKFSDDETIEAILASPWTAEAVGVGFTGGEALLHPRLFDWLEMAEQRGITSRQIITNGVPLQNEDTVQRLIEKARFTNLQVSLDADNADDFMAAKGIVKVDFPKILDSIARIAAAHKDNPNVRVATTFVIGAHNSERVAIMVDLAERLGVDVCHFSTLHLVNDDQRAYQHDTLRELPEQYSEVMARNDYTLEIAIAPPLRAPFMAFYCSSLDTHLSVDPQARVAPCCHIPWDESVGVFGKTEGNPVNNDVAVAMRRQFIAAADKNDETLLPESCRLCSRRLIGRYVFNPETHRWTFAHN